MASHVIDTCDGCGAEWKRVDINISTYKEAVLKVWDQVTYYEKTLDLCILCSAELMLAIRHMHDKSCERC